ncbi:MAG: hypothetical protein J6R32_02970 [Bacteroidales bacterium]|nr:hypothetical protein [Bacteroidales bacterium]
MNFNFKDVVKLASKGIKPTEIAELAALDENKFDKDDILSLIGSGYKTSDIKNLVETFSPSDDEDDDPGDDSENKDNHKSHEEKHEQNDDSDSGSSEDDGDDIDYKQLYEKEKKLREKLQHDNAKKGAKDPEDRKSDEEIALEIANMF